MWCAASKAVLILSFLGCFSCCWSARFNLTAYFLQRQPELADSGTHLFFILNFEIGGYASALED